MGNERLRNLKNEYSKTTTADDPDTHLKYGRQFEAMNSALARDCYKTASKLSIDQQFNQIQDGHVLLEFKEPSKEFLRYLKEKQELHDFIYYVKCFQTIFSTNSHYLQIYSIYADYYSGKATLGLLARLDSLEGNFRSVLQTDEELEIEFIKLKLLCWNDIELDFQQKQEVKGLLAQYNHLTDYCDPSLLITIYSTIADDDYVKFIDQKLTEYQEYEKFIEALNLEKVKYFFNTANYQAVIDLYEGLALAQQEELSNLYLISLSKLGQHRSFLDEVQKIGNPDLQVFVDWAKYNLSRDLPNTRLSRRTERVFFNSRLEEDTYYSLEALIFLDQLTVSKEPLLTGSIREIKTRIIDAINMIDFDSKFDLTRVRRLLMVLKSFDFFSIKQLDEICYEVYTKKEGALPLIIDTIFALPTNVDIYDEWMARLLESEVNDIDNIENSWAINYFETNSFSIPSLLDQDSDS